MVKISPSVLSADFAYLADDLAATKAAGADMLHVDIMDGVYVPNMSLGVPVVKAMRRVCDLFFDVHLMTALPSQLIDLYADAGADLITIHVETEPEKTAAAQRIITLYELVSLAFRVFPRIQKRQQPFYSIRLGNDKHGDCKNRGRKHRCKLFRFKPAYVQHNEHYRPQTHRN